MGCLEWSTFFLSYIWPTECFLLLYQHYLKTPPLNIRTPLIIYSVVKGSSFSFWFPIHNTLFFLWGWNIGMLRSIGGLVKFLFFLNFVLVLVFPIAGFCHAYGDYWISMLIEHKGSNKLIRDLRTWTVLAWWSSGPCTNIFILLLQGHGRRVAFEVSRGQVTWFYQWHVSRSDDAWPLILCCGKQQTPRWWLWQLLSWSENDSEQNP